MFRHTPWIAVCIFAIALASCGGGGDGGSSPSVATVPPIQASPSSLSFGATGAIFAQTVSVSQTNYTGTFTPSTSACTNIVTVTAGQQSGTFVVTPTNAGQCALSFSNSNGTNISVPVNVTATQFVGQ